MENNRETPIQCCRQIFLKRVVCNFEVTIQYPFTVMSSLIVTCPFNIDNIVQLCVVLTSAADTADQQSGEIGNFFILTIEGFENFSLVAIFFLPLRALETHKHRLSIIRGAMETVRDRVDSLGISDLNEQDRLAQVVLP